MRHLTIECDSCGRDITSSGNSVDWRVALLNEERPSRGGAVTDMMIYPAFENDHYFCNVRCFTKWVRAHLLPQVYDDDPTPENWTAAARRIWNLIKPAREVQRIDIQGRDRTDEHAVELLAEAFANIDRDARALAKVTP